jgi:hypothetical protein
MTPTNTDHRRPHRMLVGAPSVLIVGGRIGASPSWRRKTSGSTQRAEAQVRAAAGPLRRHGQHRPDDAAGHRRCTSHLADDLTVPIPLGER